MKAIVYTTQSSANSALASCNTIPQGDIEYMGEGPFVIPEGTKPYSRVLKHPTKAKWGLLADAKVETKLNKIAEELTSDWFPDLFPQQG